MMTATNTRKEARESLSGKWGKAILMVLAYGLISYLMELVLKYTANNSGILYMLFSIGEIIISIPISYGMLIAFLKLKRGEEVKTFDFLTIGFSNFSRSWSIAWNVFLKLIVPFIILIVLLLIVYFSGTVAIIGTSAVYSSARSAPEISGVVSIIAFIIMFICSIWIIVKRYSLVLSQYISHDEPELSGKEVVEKSQELMKGNKGNLFVLELSFIGWAILAVLTFGIGYLWLIPYIQVSEICFYEELKNKNQ